MDSGHEVIAVDVDKIKVDCINEGRSPIVEPKLDEIIKKGVTTGRLSATSDVAAAVQSSEISLICVGTPSNEDGSLKLEYVVEVSEQIGAALKDKDEYHTVVLRSTCVPGTAQKYRNSCTGKNIRQNRRRRFWFGNNPEFLRESTAVFDYYNPPKIVIGGIMKKPPR